MGEKQFLPTEDGEFNGNTAPDNDMTPVAAIEDPPVGNREAYAEARAFLEELRTFHANNAGDKAIKILRKLFGTSPAQITSAELIDRTGGNAGPVDTRGFPSELREPPLSESGEGPGDA